MRKEKEYVVIAILGILVIFLASNSSWSAKKIAATNWTGHINNCNNRDLKVDPQSQVRVVENSARPSGKNSGRVIELKPSFSIGDEPASFFFKYPFDIKLNSRGDIFVLDEEQILHFDSSGNFLRNYFKKGQGPGEMQYVTNIGIDGENLVAFDPYPRKVCRFDFRGHLLAEIKINELPTWSSLVHINGSSYYFVSTHFPDTGGKFIRVDNPNHFQVYDENARRLQELATFPVSGWAISQGGARGMLETTKL
ncbi:MAG: 6-bladed beta-propeller, partial [Acidobacteria bacterium]|nr:6-bladed beta-propeller [Acidobacteriota bacterium]